MRNPGWDLWRFRPLSCCYGGHRSTMRERVRPIVMSNICHVMYIMSSHPCFLPSYFSFSLLIWRMSFLLIIVCAFILAINPERSVQNITHRGHSSAGRAVDWRSKGPAFDPRCPHLFVPSLNGSTPDRQYFWPQAKIKCSCRQSKCFLFTNSKRTPT